MLLKSLRDVYKLVRSYISTIIVALLFMYIIRVSQIFDHYVTIITSSNIGVGDKLEQVIDPVFQLFEFTDGIDLNALLIIIVSIMQGVVITLMLYIRLWKREQIQMLTVCEIPQIKDGANKSSSTKIGVEAGVSGAFGAVISFLGVGCVPCKTALISPLLSLIFSAGGPVAFASTVIMDAILIISILFSVFAISKMLYLLAEVYYPVEFSASKVGKSSVSKTSSQDLVDNSEGSDITERNNDVE